VKRAEIYTATLGDTVYVLHAFRKKTKRTTKADVEIAKARLKEARQIERGRKI
jgi:phage-related protein